MSITCSARTAVLSKARKICSTAMHASEMRTFASMARCKGGTDSFHTNPTLCKTNEGNTFIYWYPCCLLPEFTDPGRECHPAVSAVELPVLTECPRPGAGGGPAAPIRSVK